jgi:uncharacterized membrane protein HdeD (DUF308 family)
MAHTDAAPHPEHAWRAGWWQRVLLGVVLIIAGLLVLRDATAATVVSAIVFGLALLCAGLAEVVQAFGSPHWSGAISRLLVGVLYAIGGGALVADPVAASSVLTLAFAAALIASGAVRVFLAVKHWRQLGWLLLASGLIGILGGCVILLKWPLSGLWVLGLSVGIDLIVHGIWWIASSWTAREEQQPE